MIKWIGLAIVLTFGSLASESLKSSSLVLVTTTNCPPCVAMKQTLDKMAVKYSTSTAEEMNEKSVPVLIMLEKNKYGVLVEKKRLAKLRTKEEIEKWMKE